MWVSWVTWKQITRDVSKKPQILAAMYICTWSFQKKKMYICTWWQNQLQMKFWISNFLKQIENSKCVRNQSNNC